jgi:hypothetical protein
MDTLDYFFIYAIGFLYTYKFVLSYFIENAEIFDQGWARQGAALTCASAWMIFWFLTFFISVPDDTD